MMNATSLYVSTCRLVLQADVDDPNSWTDLYRLVPYLRQSLSCSVCSNLLIEPHTPRDTNCQHHVCRSCKGGRKKLKPMCSWCKDYTKYDENLQLRILLQCYKKLCEYVISTAIYITLIEQSTEASSSNSTTSGTSSLIDLIQEGAGFKDNYKSTAGLSKSEYSILPCIYTTSSTQTLVPSTNVIAPGEKPVLPADVRTVSNGSALYSVLYNGQGNKITIKRKHSETEMLSPSKIKTKTETAQPPSVSTSNSFKKPAQKINSRNPTKRKGCRCGNATATPGKLTCCGQRCPCYVESKACLECRCRGCRNPHRPNGFKVRPHIPELQDFQLHTTILSEELTIERLDPSVTLDTVQHTVTAADIHVMDISPHELRLPLGQTVCKEVCPNTVILSEDNIQNISDGDSVELEIDV